MPSIFDNLDPVAKAFVDELTKERERAQNMLDSASKDSLSLSKLLVQEAKIALLDRMLGRYRIIAAEAAINASRPPGN